MTEAEKPFLSLSPVRDSSNRRIVLLHSDSLPSGEEAIAALPIAESTVLELLQDTSSPCVLVYLHGGLASNDYPTTLATVNRFRTNMASLVPRQIRDNFQQFYLVHVSFATRAHIYANSFQLPGREFDRVCYCDLLEDLEKHLGVDSTLLGLREVDFQYDQVMRAWVDRAQPSENDGEENTLDPAKPLINMTDISMETDFSEAPSDSNSAQQAPTRQAEQP